VLSDILLVSFPNQYFIILYRIINQINYSSVITARAFKTAVRGRSEEYPRREAPEDEVLRELQRAAREGIWTDSSKESLRGLRQNDGISYY
jgi:hypothetical protein